MQYKINQPIYVRYLELEKEEGLTDLILTSTNPSGVDQSPITFSEIGDGLYEISFTPNATGWWQVRVSCVSKPGNIWSTSYFVGTEYTTNPPQEDGKLTSIYNQLDIKLSEFRDALRGLNTKDFSTLQTQVENILAKLDVDLSTIVSEVTAQNILNALGIASGTDLLTELQSIVSNTNDVSTETTLIQVRDYLDTVETKLQTLIDKFDVNLSTRLAETTFTERLGEVQETPSQYTLLRRLKDIYDKIVSLFENGLGKLKIWDGTEVVNVSTDNKLEVLSINKGIVSEVNSSSDFLGAGETFTGAWEEVLDYSMIVVSVFTDQDSVVDGLVIQWSCDGITVDMTNEFNIYANYGKTFSFGVIAKYFRIIYTNNATTSQTFFKLRSIFKFLNQKASTHRILAPIKGDDDAELVKAVLTGKSDGEFVNVKVTPEGRLQTELVATTTNITAQILHDRFHSAINAGEWQEVLDYTVPTGYNLNVLAFEAQSQVANEAARAVYKNIMGTFACSTDTFTDGTTISAPRFASRLYAYVTSDIGSGVNDTFTITYTNAMGVTGRTANITITKNSLAGTRLEVPLQAGDRGIVDITNITHSATGQAGAVQFGGYIELLYLTLTNANVQYQTASISLGALVVLEGEVIYLQYLSGTKTTYTRRLNLLAALVPK